MNYKKLELKLRKIVEKRLEEGWSIGPTGSWGYFSTDGVARCCLVGSVVADNPSIETWKANDVAAKILNTSYVAVCSVAGGFENTPPFADTDMRAYEIGERIRRDYVEVTK